MKSHIVYKRQKKYENYEIDGDLQGQWILDEKTHSVGGPFSSLISVFSSSLSLLKNM